ncbi:stem-specific protein TSJT1-like [Impatiens glandulifera]|uniref:stem-specific protein TSJT1-like n=1 Tax=Impatiens glandulifera TaxID=253017 RepID=UPI001FB0D645|nr:stem-specific protein TSJT1-like [Impatiens glandulifera]
MLAIFKNGSVDPPKELNSPASVQRSSSSLKPKLPNEILNNFLSSHSNNGFSMGFAEKALIAFSPPHNPFSIHNRMFCGVDDIYCIFLGSLSNLPGLLRQYGLSKGANEAAFVVEAYRTLRDRGPYPADQVLRDMDGRFGFVVYDAKAGSVFVSLAGDEGVKLYWGIGGDGCVVISDNLEVIKGSCAKSFAPFPAGCMYHSEHGLMSFEQPLKKMKAMPRIDSEGILCGSNFKVDTISSSKNNNNMTRVGSEANCTVWRSQA